MTATITLDGQTTELTQDAYGLAGHVDIGGVRHRVFVTVTPARRVSVTPAKWAARRG